MDLSPGVVALLFTDLVGSTELLGSLGDDAAEELRHTHFSLLRGAVRRGDPAGCVSRLATVADTVLTMGALPFAAFVLAEQAEEAGRRADTSMAAQAARHLEVVATQIDRPLYRALSALGTAGTG